MRMDVKAIEAFVEQASVLYLDARNRTDALLDSLSDEQLEVFIAHQSAQVRHPFRRWVLDRAIITANYRHSLARARELKASMYCVWHDCRREDCPNGAHADE